MTSKRIFCLLILVKLLGCSNDQPDTQQIVDQIANAPTGIPDHWDQISISHSEKNGESTMVLKGKNATLRQAVDQVIVQITKPIEFAEELDTDKSVPELEITLSNGTWVELLSKIAETYGCSLEETDSAFTLSKLK